MFFVEKRVLTMFPYWLVVSVLIVVTILSYLPGRIPTMLLQSSIPRRTIKIIMHR